MGKIRVLIVDDSAAVREALKSVIGSEPDMEVMGAAADPVRAVQIIRDEVPDVVTLDVEMPRMDGVTFLRRLMAQHPIPVVMCSSLMEAGSRTLMEAMEAGAVAAVCKPRLDVKGFMEESRIQICDAIRGAAQARVRRAPKPLVPERKKSPDEMLAPPSGRPMAKTTDRVVAIGASTGGTEALRQLLQALPPDCPPIVIVQHMPERFTRAFADRLDEICAVTVAEATSGARLLRGQALIAPGGRHTLVQRQGAQYCVEVRDGPLVSRHRPSVDVLFRSVARAAGSNAVGVILTGMGDDGSIGLGEMRAAGAHTIGQDEATSVVYGMPKMAFERGAVARQLPLDKIPAALMTAADG
ncbi:protein-glutamate methylesterase/protein-glutamine glutaminase [Jannaschia seohaensis]|uniref:Protein-glutamate methylesterase/protein-glutamine glutaminase n=1 Tax=Jannaschia seohaensis TaxID=475081 RepID=A0A2Y9C3N0_9RHOB|nr:chemotaxis response regulator protein-glutamate methylesterase [Jannaschia seohaensis]PWJ10189.1 two-component system chemotaxis response regulator CheB [Jannaschia seohaensis]SSA51762.1 two-component system, chemotaxis family, response regulator CheB [Jannaschia seohaensis]